MQQDTRSFQMAWRQEYGTFKNSNKNFHVHIKCKTVSDFKPWIINYISTFTLISLFCYCLILAVCNKLRLVMHFANFNET